MRTLKSPDSRALGAGISILALGMLLLLQEGGGLDLPPGWLLLGLAACTGIAVAAIVTGERDLPRAAAGVSWVVFGGALLLAAGLIVLWATGALDAAGEVVFAALVVTIAIGLVSAPIWWGLIRRVTVERAARIRSEERAELGAHLHDSVLQTLALMQRRADDPAEVARLARHQERELRSWLAGDEPARPGERLADALRAAAEEVEEAHSAQIEAVVVGDEPLNERLEALVAATREALTNAAKFASDAGPVRLYAEIGDSAARVFVDDRGPGFDPDAIPGDRRGVRESIIGRMERYGGRAEIHSQPGGGTEVELEIRGGR
jgi:anti-sigma regulatory factor (Ser/Thr protein kinase)